MFCCCCYISDVCSVSQPDFEPCQTSCIPFTHTLPLYDAICRLKSTEKIVLHLESRELWCEQWATHTAQLLTDWVSGAPGQVICPPAPAPPAPRDNRCQRDTEQDTERRLIRPRLQQHERRTSLSLSLLLCMCVCVFHLHKEGNKAWQHHNTVVGCSHTNHDHHPVLRHTSTLQLTYSIRWECGPSHF